MKNEVSKTRKLSPILDLSTQNVDIVFPTGNSFESDIESIAISKLEQDVKVRRAGDDLLLIINHSHV